MNSKKLVFSVIYLDPQMTDETKKKVLNEMDENLNDVPVLKTYGSNGEILVGQQVN